MLRRGLIVSVLTAALGASVIPAYADHDIVQFGSNIHVDRNTSVHDTVCFFCNVDADGTVQGDIVVFFGNVHIGTSANHDVVNFFGHITADNNSSIGHDMVSMFGVIRLGDNVTVGKDLVAMFGDIRTAPTVSVGGDRVVQPPWIFWGPLLIFALVIILVVREFRNHRRRAFMRNYPFPPRP
jgi:hypothetical protein